MSDSEEDRLEEVDEDIDGDAGLFGDDDPADGAQSDKHELLSDEEDLRSDRDRERYDEEDGVEQETHEQLVSTLTFYRHRIPKPKDGNLHSLRVPDFIRWSPEEYKSDEYEPSQKEIAAAKADKLRPLVRFRRNAKTGDMETNTLIHRWSDGSLTISVGDEMFEIQSKSLAPPADGKYQEVQDAHYYAASASVASEALLVVGHITQQHDVRPNEVVADVALERLIGRMEEAQHGTPTDMIIQTKQDPELQKKQAELAEKERLRLQRKRETAAARLDGLGNRYPRGALSINDLEGGGRRPPGSGRKRGAPGAPRQKRRRPEYDSDDDLPPGGRQDDYDLEDDFIAKSDEEISGEGEEDDEEDILDDDDDDEEERAPRTKRQKTAEAEDDADGEADLDDVEAPAHSGDASRNRRRNVIEDDDEE